MQRILQDFMKKKKYLEHQMLGRRVVCPIGPANHRIILEIDGFQESMEIIMEPFHQKLIKNMFNKGISTYFVTTSNFDLNVNQEL